MSSIADAAYLGNSYGQTYNSAGQFDVLTTTLLDVAGNIVVDGQINGVATIQSVTGFISAADLIALTANGGNSRAFRTTSDATDISGSGAFSALTEEQRSTLLTLPQNAVPTQAILCKTGSTNFSNNGTDPLPDINVAGTYNPTTSSAASSDLGEIYADQTLATLNSGTPLLVNNSPGSADLGDIGVAGLTGDNVVTITTSAAGIFTATDGLKIHISYIIVPSAAKFLSDNY